MKRWALLVVALYMLILIVLAWPIVYLAFGPIPQHEILESLSYVYLNWWLWVWAGVLGLVQLAFLIVPVRAISLRPMTRRSLIWPAMAAVVLLAAMIIAACLAMDETLRNTHDINIHLGIEELGMIGIAWFVWAVAMLIWYTRKQKEPLGYMQRLIRFLLAGSILELVISVPAHVLARYRHYCCAGIGTFWGLAAGVSVALFAFGPAALIYFAKRYGSLRPNLKSDSKDEPASQDAASNAPGPDQKSDGCDS